MVPKPSVVCPLPTSHLISPTLSAPKQRVEGHMNTPAPRAGSPGAQAVCGGSSGGSCLLPTPSRSRCVFHTCVVGRGPDHAVSWRFVYLGVSPCGFDVRGQGRAGIFLRAPACFLRKIDIWNHCLFNKDDQNLLYTLFKGKHKN